jgi:hypothetical protein
VSMAVVRNGTGPLHIAWVESDGFDTLCDRTLPHSSPHLGVDETEGHGRPRLERMAALPHLRTGTPDAPQREPAMIRDAMTLRRGDRVRIETIIGTRRRDGRIAGFARRQGGASFTCRSPMS